MNLVVKKFSLPSIIFLIVINLVSIYFSYYLYSTELIPFKYVASILAIIFFFNITLDYWLLRSGRRRIGRLLAYIFGVVIFAVLIGGLYTIRTGSNLLSKISSNNTKTIRFSLVVLSSSDIQKEGDISGRNIVGVLSDNKYIKSIEQQSSISHVTTVASYPAAVVGLYDKSHDIMIFNEGFREAIIEFYPKFSNETRVIKTYEFAEKNAAASDLFNQTNGFNVYISGIDTYGNISTVSRSDVNIIATVNPKTKKILLTTIPRDSYVPIALGGNNQNDKLTHAGIYGVDSSVKTLENLFDIHIDAYARVNFTTLISLVDKIGGIDVDNPTQFTTDDGTIFAKGQLHLNGLQALKYSRERHNLVGGDNDRGVNQQRVLTAIFRKVASPEILMNYQEVLTVVGKAVQTNVSSENISQFVNMQIEYGKDWEVASQNVSGRGRTGGLTSYAMPGRQLYMFMIDESSLQQNKSSIQKILKS